MEGELQELRDLVTQLRVENERLKQDQPSVSSLASNTTQGNDAAAAVRPTLPGAGAASADRFVFVPRDRKCPKFSGTSGIGIDEWVEEAQACIRARCLSTADQAFFLFDHLEGEAREEIRHRSDADRSNPTLIVEALRELYGCSLSYVALQEAFFSRRQREGETLLEFSLALMGLQEKVKQQSSSAMPNAEILLRDQFVEFVLDPALRRELKQLVRRQPLCTFLDVRGEAIRWEREGMPGGTRPRSQSLPVEYGFQCGVQGEPQAESSSSRSEFAELREMLKLQQEQIGQLTQGLARLQGFQSRNASPRRGPVICRRCQREGHFARDCDGQRAPPRSRPSSRFVPATREEPAHSVQRSEN
nr:uncharacterized protein LOC129426946 [Misgurnus anguillicaudatus]XP_055039118.1 uncharacterized protein LOC129426946 [Misgurnus anguillicaudatus]XP_055039119.1 uncharacterized protein LOC129426946 [Misgurnus anguillicaudatus]XP_055039120.1 uncharacterized protein LOC129426946 [Misgurnus anguillicaudatus]XP_055039121.1 uncharacterized protein LOC129426946 [Misgurnus anguillicaudatus]